MNNTKVLIVEDETIVALDIQSALENLKLKVTDSVTNYDDALASVKNNKPDIILADIHLKDSKNGIEIAKEVQKIEHIPVIYLTAFSDDKTIKDAIATNPISYLHKPFDIKEVKAAILLGLYKINQSNQEVILKNSKHIGFDYYFDTQNKVLYYKNLLIKLSSKEKQLLNILVEANGTLVSIEKLEHHLWPDNAVSDSTLRTLIYRLRGKLEYKLIKTIPFEGFRLAPTF